MKLLHKTIIVLVLCFLLCASATIASVIPNDRVILGKAAGPIQEFETLYYLAINRAFSHPCVVNMTQDLPVRVTVLPDTQKTSVTIAISTHKKNCTRDSLI